jgi:gamma-glutamyltranspeptidase/glutathione hydrolase
LKNRCFEEIDDIERYHTQFEAMKMAFEDGISQISDPSAMRIDPNELLDPEYGRTLMSQIQSDRVFEPQQRPLTGGTVYLTAADHEGNMVSFIQSNFEDFGSGIVAPGTGVNLQNRGVSFQMDPGLPNCLAPRKKTYHTIIPGFLTKGGQAVGPFGVMGAFMQPQGHVQILMNTIDFHMNPQMALDAPRWQWMGGKRFKVEPGIPEAVAMALRQKGHEIEISQDRYSFGRGQIIWRDPETGVYAGGTDSRSDGVIAAW